MELMIESLPRLLSATKLTIQLTLISLFFGIFVGVFFALLRTSNKKIRLRVTEKISSEIINLPCHQYMTEKEIVKISKKILALI